MRWLPLILALTSFSAWSQSGIYSSDLLKLSQETICEPENEEKARAILAKMSQRVESEFKAAAEANQQTVENYLNKKETSRQFLNYLKSKNNDTYINSLSHAEFMLVSLELGLKYQILATVRFPSFELIDDGGQILQDKWLSKVTEISEHPQGCQNSPQVNSSGREIIKDQGQDSSSSSTPANSSGAQSN